MSLEASSLSIVVKSDGISAATDALNKLATAGDKAEKSAAKLAKANTGSEASAKRSEKVWYDLLDKVSKAHEREYNMLQRHNNRLYGLAQAEANKINKAYDASQKAFQRQVDSHYKQQEQIEKRSQDRLARQAEQYYKQRDRDAAKALQAETKRLAQMEAATKAAVERQRVLNSSYETSSLSQQIATLQRAQAYGAAGGNVSARFGSTAASASSSGELTRLQQQYRQLGEEAKRTNSIMSDSHAAIRGLSGSLGALWLTYGNLLPLLAGAAIGAGLREAVTGFANVEYQMTFVKSLTEDTTNSVKGLSAAMHEAAAALGIAPQEAAKGLRALAQAGLSTQESMASLKQVFKVSTVGELPMETAALALTGVANAYGLVARDLEHVGDVMVKAGAMSATSVSAMSESMKYAAGTAEQYGVSLEKLGTVLTLLGKRTITGSSAGVAANNLIAEIYSPSSDKAIKAHAKLGVKAYADGVRQELDVVIKSIREGLSRFDAESQGKLLEDMFGKKGGRGFYAVAMADQKEFLKIEEQLRESTGFTAKVFADSLQTMTGQANLTKAAITNTFAQIGEGMSEPIMEVLRGVRGAFESDGVKDALIGFAQSITTLITVVGPAVLAVGGLWTAMKVGGIVVPALIKYLGMLNMASLTAGFAAAKTAVTGFMSAMAAGNVAALAANPIVLGLVGAVTLLAGAYLLFRRNKESALDLHEKEMTTAQETLDMLDKENKLLEKKLELQRRGVSESGMEAALRKQDGEDAAAQIQSEIDTNNARIKALSSQGVQRSEGAESARQTQIDRLTNANTALNSALRERLALNAKIEASGKRREDMMFQYRETEQLRRTTEEYQAVGAEPAGTERYGDKPDKAANKIQNAAQAEFKELSKLAAGYDAKTQSLIEFYKTGQKVATESRQAIVETNRLNGMYGSTEKTNALYLKNLAQAKLTDEAKFREEKAKSFVELTGNMQQIIDGEAAFQKAAMESGAVKAGTYERQIEAAGRATQMTDQELAKAREMAKAVDEINRMLAARQKLETATTSAVSRADTAREEAEAMSTYGEVTKLTAMQVAELTIAKLRLTDAGSESAKAAMREAAATEQLNVAYRDLMKQQIDVGKKLEEAQAESNLVFADSEAEKVKIATDSRNKIVKMELEKAEAAYKTKTISGTATDNDFFAIISARQAADETIRKNEELGIVETNNLRLREWKKTVDDIEQIAREGFYSLSDKGVNIWSAMARTFKNMFKTTVMDYIYKEFAKPIMLKVIAQLAGAVGADGIATAANAMGGGEAGSITGTVTKLYNVFKAGGSFESGIAKSVTTGMEKIGFSSSTAGTAGKWAGTAGNIIAGYTAGSAINKGISNGYETGSGMMTLQKVGTAVASYFGPVFGAIAGAIGGTINRLFGMRPKEVTKTGISGAIEGDGKTVSGQAYSMWEQKGGVFRSDKNGIDAKALDSTIVNSFLAGMNEMKAASTAFANGLGISADVLIGYGKHFDIVFGEDAAANQEAIAKLFTDIGDEMAVKLIPNIMEMAKQGETASQALERLSNTFTATKNVADILGKSVAEVFGGEGLSSEKARTKFVDMSGGSDAVTQKTAAYVNAIYSESEKLAPVQKALTQAMSSLGLASVKTKEQFKATVDQLNLTKEADIKLFNSLMDLAPAFAEVANAADTAKEQAVEKARSDLNEAYQREADAITKVRDKMIDFAKSLKDLQKSTLLGDLSPLTPQQKYLEAKAQFDQISKAAMAGDEGAQDKFADSYRSFLEASQLVNASGQQYQKDFQYAQKVTEEATSWTQRQVDVAKASLDALNMQVAGLITLNNTMLTVTEAINNLVKAQGGSAGTTAADNAQKSIESLYNSLLGRKSDEAGMKFWMDSISKGMPISEIAKLIGNSAEARGEVKPQQAITPVTAIQSYSATTQSTSEVATAIVEVKAVLEEVKATIAEGNNNTVGAIYDSQDSAATRTVGGISEALASSNKNKMYQIVER